ncbi:MAG: class II glutamine amidotransferase [Casimicrobium sp.]
MCRLLAYSGDPIFLEELVCKPQHSLVRQSMQADESKVATNGDGFGIGWYTGYDGHTAPGIYREVMPAWSDENLLALCSAVRSPLFFAHVRATTGTAVARQNCHPYRFDHYLFMHNGQIGDYAKVRRELEAALPDDLYAARKGATDSELMFLLAMAHVQRGASPIEAVQHMLAEVRASMDARGVRAPLRFAAALSDGQQVFAFRYASDDKPPSLYFNQCDGGTVVASEPLQDRATECCPEWTLVPPNTAVTVLRGAVASQPLTLACLDVVS